MQGTTAPTALTGPLQVELYSAVRRLVFLASVEVLFGAPFMDSLWGRGPGRGAAATPYPSGSAGGGVSGSSSRGEGGGRRVRPLPLEKARAWDSSGGLAEGPLALEAAFFSFEAGFELAASPVPHMFQPGFVQARSQLLAWLRAAHSHNLFCGTPVGELVDKSGVRDALVPNLLLALLWASQANTAPSVFWTVARLLLPSQAQHLKAVLQELHEAMALRAVPGAAAALPDSTLAAAAADASLAGCGTGEVRGAAAAQRATERRSTASRCAAEAIRLAVQGLDVRVAAADLALTSSTGQKVVAPRGCLLAVCPFLSHQDAALFPPSGREFDPDRGNLVLGDGTAVVPSLAGLAFGGGPYRCPGRFFAEMEVALVAQLVLAHCPMELLPSPPAPSAAAGAGLAEAAALLVGQAVGSELALWGCGIDPSLSTGAGEAPSSEDSRLLPAPDIRRLVGVKIPARPCWVQVHSRD
ncbi:cytochrome P450 [Haematococcus lacustris]